MVRSPEARLPQPEEEIAISAPRIIPIHTGDRQEPPKGVRGVVRRNGVRRITILGVVAALLLVSTAETALGRPERPSPPSVWEDFPLDRAPTGPVESTAPSPTPEDDPEPSSEGGGSPSGLLWLLLAGALLTAGLLVTAAATRGARRTPRIADGKAQEPPRTASALPAPAAASAAPAPASGVVVRSAQPPIGIHGRERGAARSTALAPVAFARAMPAQHCEVAVARRRNRAWFYARLLESDTPIVASPEFPVRRGHALQLTPEAVAALEALTEGLARLGWSFSGQGAAWFCRRFVRLEPEPRARRASRAPSE